MVSYGAPCGDRRELCVPWCAWCLGTTVFDSSTGAEGRSWMSAATTDVRGLHICCGGYVGEPIGDWI